MLRTIFSTLVLSVMTITANAGMIVVPNGAILFVENSSRIVEAYTDSPTSHVAVLMYEQGEPYVYEAKPPRVKKYHLREWFEQYGRLNEGSKRKAIISIFMPNKALSKKQLLDQKSYLDEQIDRRYSLRGYVREIPGDGTHCSEMTASLLGYEKPYSISPAKLRRMIAKTHSQVGKSFFVEIKPEYQRSRIQRTAEWVFDRSRWCEWSCAESLNWCR